MPDTDEPPAVAPWIDEQYGPIQQFELSIERRLTYRVFGIPLGKGILAECSQRSSCPGIRPQCTHSALNSGLERQLPYQQQIIIRIALSVRNLPQLLPCRPLPGGAVPPWRTQLPPGGRCFS